MSLKRHEIALSIREHMEYTEHHRKCFNCQYSFIPDEEHVDDELGCSFVPQYPFRVNVNGVCLEHKYNNEEPDGEAEAVG